MYIGTDWMAAFDAQPAYTFMKGLNSEGTPKVIQSESESVVIIVLVTSNTFLLLPITHTLHGHHATMVLLGLPFCMIQFLVLLLIPRDTARQALKVLLLAHSIHRHQPLLEQALGLHRSEKNNSRDLFPAPPLRSWTEPVITPLLLTFLQTHHSD
jgi:hypothetical protein